MAAGGEGCFRVYPECLSRYSSSAAINNVAKEISLSIATIRACFHVSRCDTGNLIVFVMVLSIMALVLSRRLAPALGCVLVVFNLFHDMLRFELFYFCFFQQKPYGNPCCCKNKVYCEIPLRQRKNAFATLLFCRIPNIYVSLFYSFYPSFRAVWPRRWALWG